MAKKQTKVEVKKGSKTTVKKTGKKVKITLGKKAFITIVVLVLIAAIALTTFYIVAPETFKKLFKIATKGGGELPPTDLTGEILQVHYVDIGQGDSIIIKFPDGKNMIIDAGGSTTSRNIKPWDKLKAYIDDLGITTFDYALLTHTDSDHSDYLDNVIKTYDVKNIYLPDFDGATDGSDKDIAGKIPTKTFGEVVEAARAETYTENGVAKQATIHLNLDTFVISQTSLYKITAYCQSAEYYDTVKASNAKKLNSVSPILILEYSNRSLVFTGDAEGEGANDTEHWFIDKGISIDCDVLKVGHHGSAAGTTTDFLEYIDPEYAVISCGIGNSHGHPTEAALTKLLEYTDKISDGDYVGISRTFRTDQDGDILLRIGSEGGGMQFDTQTEQEAKTSAVVRIPDMRFIIVRKFAA